MFTASRPIFLSSNPENTTTAGCSEYCNMSVSVFIPELSGTSRSIKEKHGYNSDDISRIIRLGSDGYKVKGIVKETKIEKSFVK